MAKTLLYEVLYMAFVKYFFAFAAKTELTEVFEQKSMKWLPFLANWSKFEQPTVSASHNQLTK